MIKQLQLRGISRTPSDRAVADGGCAESLNVHLDNAETAPVLPPEDASDEIYGQLTKYPIVYIHKMMGTTNYIGHRESVEQSNQGFYAYGADVTDHEMRATTSDSDHGLVVPYDEVFQCATGIGNTLIIYTDKNPYYYLYKDHKYTYLGNSIPRPMVEVVTKPSSTTVVLKEKIPVGSGEDSLLRLKHTNASSSDTSTWHPDVTYWNAAKAENHEAHAELLETMRNIWEAVILEAASQRTEGRFIAPFFIRYALRLYDGSYISTSAPILLGAGLSKDWVSAWIDYAFSQEIIPGSQDVDPTAYQGFYFNARLNNIFDVRIKGDYDTANWGDIVKAIDFFASDPIYAPNQETGFGQMSSSMEYHDALPTKPGYDISFEGMDASARATTIRNEVLSKGQFYKIKSIDLNGNEMGDLRAGTMKLSNSENVSGDGLYVQETFPDDYRDSIQYIPTIGSQNFNGRLMLVGAREMLSRGDMFLNGQDTRNTTYHSATQYQLRFKIVNPINGNVNYVLAQYKDGTSHLKPAFFSGDTQHFGTDTAGSSDVKCAPFAWIAYPDTRCTEVEVSYWTSNTRFTWRCPLEKHPLLECVYAFFGYGTTLQSWAASGHTSISPSDSETRAMRNDNKLLLSQFENPFIFPAENIVTFGDRLIGAATVSVPLSEGQYGEYPLYAFTEGGIRVLVTTAEGTIAAANAHPNLSRHVALPGTILGMEQSVIFATERGVMRLSGNQVTELSAAMIGPAYVLDVSLADATTGILVGSPWADLLPASENITLNEYMSQAKVAYDSKNYRLVFFRDGKPYQFVYKLDTQTWHKIYTGITGARILNSYPECLVAYTSTSAKVARFSNLPTAAMYANMTANHVYGIIATRPFDLDAPDIRKSINDIRIRGRYNRADVQYILLGSFDGINWKRLTSLRGGSYKVFRLVLLTKLTASERVTWIDVDYETRMTNRLR